MPFSKDEKSITPSVSASSVADRDVAVLEAQNQAQQELISFLSEWKQGLKLLGHNLSGEDLVPFFQRYAWTLIKIRYGENILGAPSSETATKIIRASIDKVLEDICGRNGHKAANPGIWCQMVKLACKAVNLWFWETSDGEFSRGLLFRPKRAQLRALLLAQGSELLIEYRKSVPKQDRPQLEGIPPATKPAEPKHQLPLFAQWLEARMGERNWNWAKLISYSKADPKTIRKIYKGEKITQKPLAKLANGLSKKFGVILPSEIEKIQEQLLNPSDPLDTSAPGELHLI